MSPTADAPTLVLEDAGDEDMAAVQAIYAHHVLNGLASFEEVPPDLQEMQRRREAITGAGLDLPYLVARLDGRIVGFAYAGPYRNRTAYRFTVEDSIYLAPEATGLGIGKRLLGDLIERCTRLGYRQMVAVIGDSGNSASIAVHEAMGFSRAGTLVSSGYKFERWVDTVFMQRPLGPGDGTDP